MLIDTHAHVNFNAFKDDGADVLKRTTEGNVQVIMPGTQYSTSKRAVELADRYGEGVYAAVGIHPIHLGEQRKVDVQEVQSSLDFARDKEPGWMVFETREEEFDYEKYKALAQNKKTVAIGEVGLDYYYEPKSKEKREASRMKQKNTLLLQLKLAEELSLPVILHCRKAHDDLIEFLSQKSIVNGQRLRGVVHCYTGTLAQAEKFYTMGLYFGFNGLIFKNVPALPDPKEIIANIPLNRILLETDSPYLIPPMAGTERNEPLFVKYVAEEIARIKGVSIEDVASVTTQNAKSLFSFIYKE